MTRTTGERVPTGAVMSSYDHDAAALALRWAIRRADDEGQRIPCRGQDMVGTDVPAIRLLLCTDCPVRRECGRFGIAVIRSNRAKHAGVWGGALLINQKDADRLAEQLDAEESQAQSVAV